MKKSGGKPSKCMVGFSFFFNFNLLLLKFIYHNSVYIALSPVLKGVKRGKQVAK